MIDRNVTVEYLDPLMWGRLGAILQIYFPQPRILHALETETEFRFFMEEGIKPVPKETVREKGGWKEIFPGADEIRIYTFDTAEKFLADIQAQDVYHTDTRDYMEKMRRLLNRDIRVEVLKERRSGLWEHLETYCRKDGVYNIGVTKGEELYFHCILEVRQGNIARVSSSDRYEKDIYNWEKICENVEKEFPCEVRHFLYRLEDQSRSV